MLPINSLTASVIIWLFGGISILHIVAMALIWCAVFIPGNVGFKSDTLLRVCTGIYLLCEAAVTLLGVSGTVGLICTIIGGAALFFGIGRLIRWLVMKRKKA